MARCCASPALTALTGLTHAAAGALAAASTAPPAPGPGAGAAACQLSALGVAAAWRLGSWQLLRGYLGVLESAGGGGGGGGGGDAAGLAAALSASDQWEVMVGALLEAVQRGARDEVRICSASSCFAYHLLA